jgi:phage terminase large subunit GpA-like protein
VSPDKSYAVVERLREESRDALETAVRQALARAYSPPPKMPLDEWADTYRYLSPEAAALPGKWKTANEPMARGPMRAMSDPLVEKVSCMCAAQILKTELLLNTIAYYAHGDPAPMMMVLPTIEMAEAISTDRVAPMIRDTPAIRKLFGVRQRTTADKILHKSFPGGQLTFAGANSPASLSSRPKRVLLCDEVDRYPASSGGQGSKGEGDPVGLAEERTNTFFNRKIGLMSTPTNKGTSRIEQAYEEGDGREYYVPCPHCGVRQVIKWAGVKWDKGADGKPDPNTARYECRADAHDPETGELGCGKPWTELERQEAIDAAGRLPDYGWIAARPFKGHASFHATQLSSRRVPLARIVEKWLNAQKSVERLRQFVNTVLAETWEEGGERADPDTLYGRREPYDASKELPPEVGLITIGVDIQRNRWEAEVVGWGPGEESWSLEYQVHYADPSAPDYWQSLDTFISKTWQHPTGAEFRAEAVCVDSGDNTQAVYDFCRPRYARRVFAIKGPSNSIGKPIWPKKATRNAGKKIDVFLIGLDNAKADTQSRLMLKEPGPGYCHFPLNDAYDEAHFKGLTIEKAVTKYRFGIPYREWHCPEGARNEPWDCRIYAYAALKSLVVNIGARLSNLRTQADRRMSSSEPTPPPAVGKKGRRVHSRGVTA